MFLIFLLSLLLLVMCSFSMGFVSSYAGIHKEDVILTEEKTQSKSVNGMHFPQSVNGVYFHDKLS